MPHVMMEGVFHIAMIMIMSLMMRTRAEMIFVVKIILSVFDLTQHVYVVLMESAQQCVILIWIAGAKLFLMYVLMNWMVAVAIAVFARVMMTVILLVKNVLMADA